MQLEYNDIVVAVDGSEASNHAFKKALNIVKNNDARMIITHIVDARTFATAEAYDRTLAERADEYAMELLDGYMDEAKEAGIDNVIKCVEYGSPKAKITKDISKKFAADLIICGATGLNAVERFLIGSVSENIVQNATCDVLVVR